MAGKKTWQGQFLFQGRDGMVGQWAPLLVAMGSFLPQPAPISVGEPACSAFQAVATSHAGDFLLFTRGLRILEPTEGGPSFSHDPHEENMIHSAVIVFNLALVFHLSSLQPGCDTQNKLLGRAMNFYQKSYMLVTNILNAHHGKSTKCMFVDLLVMAVWNNQAHIQLECYFDLKLSGLLLQQLYSMALEVKRTIERVKRVSLCNNNNNNGSSNHHHETAVLLDQHVDSFLFNAVAPGLRVHTTAPAA
jgi:hypothetical protein